MLGRGAGAHATGTHDDDGSTLLQAPWGFVDIAERHMDGARCVTGLPLAVLPDVQQGRTVANQLESLGHLDLGAEATVRGLAAEEPPESVEEGGGG